MGGKTPMQDYRVSALFAAALVIAAGPASSPARSAEIKVLNANALTVAMKELADSFAKDTGHHVTFNGMNPGLVDQRVKASEVYDIVINATEAVEAYEKQGKLRTGTRKPLARVGIGVAVRNGVKVDLSTVESTRKALL